MQSVGPLIIFPWIPALRHDFCSTFKRSKLKNNSLLNGHLLLFAWSKNVSSNTVKLKFGSKILSYIKTIETQQRKHTLIINRKWKPLETHVCVLLVTKINGMLQFSYAGWFSIMLCTSYIDMCYRLSHKSVECTTNKFNFLPLTTHKTPLLLKGNHTSSLIKSSVKRNAKIKTVLNGPLDPH